jgi:hypothetical protein
MFRDVFGTQLHSGHVVVDLETFDVFVVTGFSRTALRLMLIERRLPTEGIGCRLNMDEYGWMAYPVEVIYDLNWLPF